VHASPQASAIRRSSQSPAPVQDWSKLSRGDAVRVVRRDGTTMLGHIDMFALDRSVFWIIQGEGRGRVMVCSADRPLVAVLAGSEISG
jgi:hypothetical protein